jgi:hypothetical protein
LLIFIFRRRFFRFFLCWALLSLSDWYIHLLTFFLIISINR